MDMTIPNILPDERTAPFAFDEETDEWIPFRNRSDALIARLYLDESLPSRHIDTFLELLRTAEFKPSELSFTKTTEIDAGIANYRQVRARGRAMHYEFPTTKLPYDIFENIIEQIALERDPLSTEDPSSCFGSHRHRRAKPRDSIAARLKSLSLVHRSLTPLAQKALGQRIFAQHKELVQALAEEPFTRILDSQACFQQSFPPTGTLLALRVLRIIHHIAY